MKPIDPSELVANWPDRQRRWQRELGRIRIGVEPLQIQLERLRRVNLAMMMVCGGIALIFGAIFTAFRHPGIGLAVIAVIMIPAALAWDRFQRLSRSVANYLSERDEVERRTTA